MKVQIFSFALLALLATAYALTGCPDVDGEEAVSVANPEDCSSFYTCEAGNYVYTECSANLEYNAELGVCDWPEDANCSVASDADAEAEK